MSPNTPQQASSDYVVIARRYRPQTFSEVVGQKSVVTQLQNEIRDHRIGHGYLLCGPRGTGKTSTARIFAKALNCEKGPTTDPCGVCSQCQEIAAGSHLDVIEVDAAFYTKVEETRGLLEGVHRGAFKGRYKIYIIDEVHMLSVSSFNALLKNLEEPPERVVFIFCTTNPEKIPETVISRLRRLNCDRIKMSDITTTLKRIMEKEGVSCAEGEETAILNAIALASEGGLRDAEVYLDQVISVSSGEVTLETVRSILGVVESDIFTRLLKHMAERETKEALLLIADMVDRGRDLSSFVKMFVSFLRDVMLIKAGAPPDLLRVADAGTAEFKEVVEALSMPMVLNTVQQFVDLEEKMKGAAPPRFLLEFALIKLTSIDPRLVLDPGFGPGPGGGGGVAAGGRPGAGAAGPAPRRAPAPPSAGPRAMARPAAPSRGTAQPAAVLREAAPELEEPPQARIETIHTTDAERWDALLEYLQENAMILCGTLRRGRLVEASPERFLVELPATERSTLSLLEKPDSQARLREAIRQAWGRPMSPKFTISEQAAPAPAPPRRTQVEAEDDFPDESPQSFEEASFPRRPQTAAHGPRPEPVMTHGDVKSLKEAMEIYPEFREACEMVERCLGVKPSSFNGRKIETI
ncbi:MAG: DNA polymerase III subunit gamma/tau [Sumerlaeia bacterium]